MSHHDVVVVGASSGGVEGLITLLTGLPDDLRAAMFVVLHVRPHVPSQLPAILNRVGTLPAAHAVDGEPIRRGRVYIAPPACRRISTVAGSASVVGRRRTCTGRRSIRCSARPHINTDRV